MSVPSRTAFRQCETCARDFEWTPGHGRPPLRCPRCREAQSGAPKKPAVALVPKSDDAPHRVAIIAPERAKAGALDVPALTERVLAEIGELEQAIGVRLGVIRALERYAETERE